MNDLLRSGDQVNRDRNTPWYPQLVFEIIITAQNLFRIVEAGTGQKAIPNLTLAWT